MLESDRDRKKWQDSHSRICLRKNRQTKKVIALRIGMERWDTAFFIFPRLAAILFQHWFFFMRVDQQHFGGPS